MVFISWFLLFVQCHSMRQWGKKNHSIETESAYKSDRTTGEVSTLDTRDNGERKGNAEQEKKKQNKNDKRYDV